MISRNLCFSIAALGLGFLGNSAFLSVAYAQNHSPELSPVGDRSVMVGQNLTFQLVASDADGDSLQYSVVRPVGRLSAENHWVGNTHGDGSALGGGLAVSNFLEHMVVVNVGELHPQFDNMMPLVVTRSFWDETNWGDGAYHNGRRVSKGEFFNRNISSRTAIRNLPRIDASVRDSLTATIENFYGRAFLGNIMPPPEGEHAPWVSLSDGRQIRSVEDPTAVAFDNQGRLWVADNGADHNIKIFDLSIPGAATQVETFGENGGVFAPPVRGRAGVKRFWGIRGLGFGANGDIYVGNTGIPMQTQGGTDIRVFNSSGEFLWDLRSLFMHVADIEPREDGLHLHTAGQSFELDLDGPVGGNWKTLSSSIDPFRFVDDPRLQIALGVAYYRVIEGKRFLFATTLNNACLAVFRYEDNSDIAIPAALFWVAANGQNSNWGAGKYPIWTGTWDANKGRRLMWRDENGNGSIEEGEFREYRAPVPYLHSMDVDEAGNLWFGGTSGPYSTHFREGGVLLLPFGGVDGYGVPLFPESGFRFIDIPTADLAPLHRGAYVTRIRYLSGSDTLVLGTGDYYPKHLHVFTGILGEEGPQFRFTLDLGYDDLGLPIRLDDNSAEMTLPFTYAVDEDYLYVGYLDRGKDERRRGEISVYRLQDGSQVGWISPGPETNHYSGALDMMISLQVRKLPDGTRILCVEENGGGKFMVYRWIPGE